MCIKQTCPVALLYFILQVKLSHHWVMVIGVNPVFLYKANHYNFNFQGTKQILIEKTKWWKPFEGHGHNEVLNAW